MTFRLLRLGGTALVAVAATSAVVVLRPSRQLSDGLPQSSLAVWTGNGWREWWRSAAATERWRGSHPAIERALTWRAGQAGVDWAELRLRGRGEAARVRVIVVRLDPRRLRFRLDTAYSDGGQRAAWSVAQAPAEAVFAVNAGQFAYSRPWGWVMLAGREYLAPGIGPLSAAIAFDGRGGARWIPGDSLADPGLRLGWVTAFQSYPVLLDGDGAVPGPLRSGGQGVDLRHRDARLALGTLRDGRLLVALTRFDGAGGVLDFVPFGLTTPEMAAVMGALGADRAVMLDGGISSQMLIRTPEGVKRWIGLRRVPLGLLAFPAG